MWAQRGPKKVNKKAILFPIKDRSQPSYPKIRVESYMRGKNPRLQGMQNEYQPKASLKNLNPKKMSGKIWNSTRNPNWRRNQKSPLKMLWWDRRRERLLCASNLRSNSKSNTKLSPARSCSWWVASKSLVTGRSLNVVWLRLKIIVGSLRILGLYNLRIFNISMSSKDKGTRRSFGSKEWLGLQTWLSCLLSGSQKTAEPNSSNYLTFGTIIL